MYFCNEIIYAKYLWHDKHGFSVLFIYLSIYHYFTLMQDFKDIIFKKGDKMIFF